MKQAIVISANTASVGVVRALGQMGVPVVVMHYNESEDIAHVSKYVVKRIKVPHPENDEPEFLRCLVENAAHHAGALLVPTSDESVLVVARHKEVLAQHYVVACSDLSIAEQFVDKKHTYTLAERVAVPYPKTLVPTSVAEVERFGGEIDYPCLLKPCHSHRFHASFRRKVFVIENPEELLSRYQDIAAAGLEVMIQELIPGNDTNGVNYNCYFWDGKPLVEFTSAKIRHAWPRFGFPCAVVSRHVPEVIERGRALLAGLDYYGFANIEFKRDPRDGVHKLMEINGRHNMSCLLAVRCGINFPWTQYNHLINGELPKSQQSEQGIYWLDPFRDIGYGIKYYRQEQYRVRELIRPYFKPHVFATLDIEDPKPAGLRIMHLLKRVTRRRGGKLLRLPRRLFRRSKKMLLRARA